MVSRLSPIVVTGLGAISALGPDVASLWRGLCAGQRGFRRIRGFDAGGCRVQLGGEAPQPRLPDSGRWLGLRRAHRTAAFALDAAAQALAQSGLSGSALGRTGLVLGTTGCSDDVLKGFLERVRRPGYERSSVRSLKDYAKRGLVDSVAQALGVGGTRSVVNTACSSGLVAIVLAADWLRVGGCDAVIAGGSDHLTLHTLAGFCSLRAVDSEPCRPFDRRRRGMTLGEGAGILVLERLEDARARGAKPLGVLAGAGMTADAQHLTAPDALGLGAARAARAALNEAGIGPEQIGFINAHGTATPHNDRAEVVGMRTILGARSLVCPLSTVKGHIGHCLGAAGAIEAVVTLLSLRYGWVPPTAGLEEPEFEGMLDFVRRVPRRVSASYALSNSFGFGGNNASVVFAHPEGLGAP
ncbi:beta-ketoacyl-[acyl-carrier-protein] synthase family protein [Myxococcota bacterium]